MPGKLNAVDMSKYSQELTAKEALCMVDEGVRLVIAGTGHKQSLGQWSEQQAGVALDAGLVLDGYRWLNLSEPIVPQMDNAFASMGQYLDRVRMWWIDAEDTTTQNMSPAEVLDAIGDAVDYCDQRQARVGIYTGSWWWKPKTGDSDMFADRPLWNAYYAATEGSLPYGGWEDSAIWQYEGNVTVCGQLVDLNEARNLTPPVTQDLEELVLLIASVLAGYPNGVPFQTVDEALDVFRQLELADMRVMMGLAQTQVALDEHEDRPTILGGAHSD